METTMTGRSGTPHGDNPDAGMSVESNDLTMDPKIQEVIGKALRAYADDIIKEPVPDKFLMLLAKLEAKERGQS
jgi:hypothetical protein